MTSRQKRAPKRRKPAHGDMLLLVRALNDDAGSSHYRFDLTVEEFASIGFVTTQWSYLEYVLFERTAAIARRRKLPVPPDAIHLSLNKRLSAFRLLVDQAIKRPQIKSYYKALIAKISNAAGDRHKITHDLWTYNPRNPAKLWLTHARKGGRSKSVDMEQLGRFGEHIGALSLALANPPSFGGRGPSRTFAYVSRSFLLKVRDGNVNMMNHFPPG